MSTISRTTARVTIDDDDRIVVNGTPWPWWVELGLNGRWFTITEDQRSWADQLQGLDNVSRTGQPTREDAAARVEEIMRPRLEDEARGLAGLGGLAGLAGLADLDAAAERRLLGYS